MTTHEELTILRSLLAGAGWQRLNGNTWALSRGKGQWELTTSYVSQEATLTLGQVTSLKKKTYRGAHPLSWANNIPGVKVGSNLGNVLDTTS